MGLERHRRKSVDYSEMRAPNRELLSLEDRGGDLSWEVAGLVGLRHRRVDRAVVLGGGQRYHSSRLSRRSGSAAVSPKPKLRRI